MELFNYLRMLNIRKCSSLTTSLLGKKNLRHIRPKPQSSNSSEMLFDLDLKVIGLLGFAVLAEAACYPPLYNYEAGHDPQADSNLKECDVLPYYNPHLSCCPQDSTCLDNGLCLTPSNNSLEILQYAGCTYLTGYGSTCPGAEYCAMKGT